MALDLGRVVSTETGFLHSRDPGTVRASDVAFVSTRGSNVPVRSEASFPVRRIWPDTLDGDDVLPGFMTP